MQILALNDMNLFGREGMSAQPVRVAARAVLFDECGRVALVHVHTFEHITLPGGGLETGETPEAAAVREVREETGYDCTITGELGYIDENRGEGDYVQRSYYFTAKAKGERGKPRLTEKESRLGVTLEWYTLEDAFDVVSSVPHEILQRFYIQKRDIAVLTRVALFSQYALPLGNAVAVMRDRLLSILGGETTIYLHGSVTMGDYKRGWSDIDILVLTKAPLTCSQAEALVSLRQTLVEETGNKAYRSFEGGILPLEAFLSGTPARTVYWGTSGQRITDGYTFDPFSRLALIDDGILISGSDIRSELARPSALELRSAINAELGSIKAHAVDTGDSVYSAGWLFDIARCLYTLETGKVVPKTRALVWALKRKLCPEPDIAHRALRLRRAPEKYLCDSETRLWLGALADKVLCFAAVLEDKLKA